MLPQKSSDFQRLRDVFWVASSPGTLIISTLACVEMIGVPGDEAIFWVHFGTSGGSGVARGVHVDSFALMQFMHLCTHPMHSCFAAYL